MTTTAPPPAPNLNWNVSQASSPNHYSPDLIAVQVFLAIFFNCDRAIPQVILVEDEEKCLARAKEVFYEKCQDSSWTEDCERVVNNAIWSFCNEKTYGGCDDYPFKEKPLPTLPPTTTQPPTLPPTTTEPTTTTAAPFPILPAVGGFAGGALLMAVILIATFFIWKKKKAKKAGMGPSGSGSKSPAASKSKTPTPGGKSPGGKSPKNHPRNSVYLGKGPD